MYIRYLLFLIIAFCASLVQVQAQVTDEEEDDETEEFESDSLYIETEGVFDDAFSGYRDIYYWDVLRDPRFTFDTMMIPAQGVYPAGWDTVTINPYKVSFNEMNDTVLLALRDSMDCRFHPPAIGDISSDFGFRRWGRRAKFHYGVDIRMDVGDPVYAMFDGVVRVAKRSADYGFVVLIRHYNGLETLYAHFNQLLTYPGKPVKSGDIIGLAGSTGRSTGPHLHFEVRYQGEKLDPNKIIHFPSGSIMGDTLQIDKSCFSHLYQIQAQKLKAAKRGKSKYHTVRKGDTLSKIAYRYGISVNNLARINGISKKTALRPGKRIRVR